MAVVAVVTVVAVVAVVLVALLAAATNEGTPDAVGLYDGNRGSHGKLTPS